MKVLLDTCSFLWIVDDSHELSDAAREVFQDAGNEIFLSAVSAWEITLKHGMGRLNLDRPPAQYVPHYRELHRIKALPLEEGATVQLTKLPTVHKDPFDRMLVCQSIFHGFPILTPDPLISQYPIRTVVETGMDGSVIDPLAAGVPVISVGLERDGLRNGWLAIAASMANEVKSWAGVYVARPSR